MSNRKNIKVEAILDRIQLRLGMMKNSTGWLTERPRVKGELATVASLIDHDFPDRWRFVPNIILEPKAFSMYEDDEGVTAYYTPDDCDVFRIESISVKYANLWTPLDRGISQAMRDAYLPGTPYFTSWDVMECGDIEVWPHPTNDLPVRASYYRLPTDYMNEQSYIDIDPELLVLGTLSSCAPMYRRPDVEAIMAQFNTHIGNIRSEQLNGMRFVKGGRVRGTGTPDAADRVYQVPRL